MDFDLRARLAAIKWDEFTHPCGFQSREIPSVLLELNSDCAGIALRAAKRLWNVVCHQGSVGSSAVPTLPFLLERLATVGIDIQPEILDIVYQVACAACTNNCEDWAIKLRGIFTANRSQFARLLASPNEDVSTFAEMILEQIDATGCAHIDHNRTA